MALPLFRRPCSDRKNTSGNAARFLHTQAESLSRISFSSVIKVNSTAAKLSLSCAIEFAPIIGLVRAGYRRICQQPGQGDLRHGSLMCGGNRIHFIQQSPIFLHEIFRHTFCTRRIRRDIPSVFSSQKAGCQRTIGNDTNISLMANCRQLALKFSAVHKTVLWLNGFKARQTKLFRSFQCLKKFCPGVI